MSTWMAASRVGDVQKVLSLMTDDAVFLMPGQSVMRKADFAAAMRLSPSKVARNSRVRATFKKSRSMATGRSCGQE